MAPPVYKVFRLAEWQAFAKTGSFAGSADDLRDGFIHLSMAAQVPRTLEKYFAGEDFVVLAEVDAARAGHALKFELSRDGILFPHLYGILGIRSVSRAERLLRGVSGFPLPSWMA